jgi:hypothetical protein
MHFGLDLTLTDPESGHNLTAGAQFLTIEIKRPWLNEDTWRGSSDRTLRSMRPVTPTGVFGRLVEAPL